MERERSPEAARWSRPIRLLAIATLAARIPAVSATTAGPTLTGSRIVPAEIVGATILLPGRVNGSERLWFLLDTGANSCVLDQRVAQRLGLPPTGEGEATGAGAGSIPYLRYRPEDVAFDLAGEVFRCEHTISLDLSSVPLVVGHAVDGILGSDFISQYTVEMSYDAGTVRLHDRETFEYGGPGDSLPLEFDRRLPYVRAEITVPGVPPTVGRLLVDSGSEDAVDDPLLLRSSGPLEQVTGGVGLGEEYQVHFGHLARVRLGRFEFTAVPSVAPGVALLGGAILRRFRVIADYARQRLILEPGAHMDDPFDEDASGLDLRLTADGAAFAVHSVSPDSAGAEAGAHAGDELLAIDGAAASELGLARARRLLMIRGARYVLTLRREGQGMSLELKTRP